MTRVARSTPTRDGGYELRTYPDCTRLYWGRHRGLSVLVAGRQTEHEKLFKRSELAAAEEWAIEHDVPLENVSATGLCEEAVVALMGE